MSKKGMSNVSLWSTESTKWAWVFPLVLCWLSISPSAQFQDWSCCTPPIRRKDPSINVSLHVILRACSVHPSGWGRGWVLQHVTKDLNEVVQTPQVPVLPVSFGPGRSVVQGLGWRQWDGLTKVNHPYSGQAWSIVHEQQRTPNHLKRNRAKFWAYETWFVVFQRWHWFGPGRKGFHNLERTDSSPRVFWKTLTSLEHCAAPLVSADNSSEETYNTQL